MLSNTHIQSICNHYGIQPLRDIVQKDLLQYQGNGFYVLNLQDSNVGNGTHWVGLILDQDVSVYFDSYGGPPPQRVLGFIQKNSRHLLSSQEIIQELDGPGEDVCGYYVIALFLMKARNPTATNQQLLRKFVSQFKEDPSDNLRVLKSIFKKWLPTGRPVHPLIQRLYLL